MSAVQKLYEICMSVFGFSERHPSARDIQLLRSAIDKIKCTDVGLKQGALEQDKRGFGYLKANWHGGRSPVASRRSLAISYLHIHENEKFSMGIFCFPPNAGIPLHDHPGMTVFSKILYGSMHVKAYDWLNAKDPRISNNVPEVALAKLAIDDVLTAPCEASILYPNSCNIHAFTARTPCAMLDVLAPPYSPKDGRYCTYYRDYPFAPNAVTWF